MFIKTDDGFVNISRIERVRFNWDKDEVCGEVCFIFSVNFNEGRLNLDATYVRFKNEESYNQYVEYVVNCLSKVSMSYHDVLKESNKNLSYISGALTNIECLLKEISGNA